MKNLFVIFFFLFSTSGIAQTADLEALSSMVQSDFTIEIDTSLTVISYESTNIAYTVTQPNLLELFEQSNIPDDLDMWLDIYYRTPEEPEWSSADFVTGGQTSDSTWSVLMSYPLENFVVSGIETFLTCVITGDTGTFQGDFFAINVLYFDTIYLENPSLVTGLREIQPPKALMFPNPANEFVTIQDDHDATATITNMLGQMVRIIPTNEQVNIADLQTGVYYINRKQKLLIE